MPCSPSHLNNGDLNLKLFDLYSKSIKGDFLWLTPPPFYNFSKFSRSKLKH
jgi:hypothetical protein